jgi:hypothetical protein
LLPFLEQENVHGIGRGAQGSAKADALALLAGTPVGLLYCPSRRAPLATPNTYGPVERAGFDRGSLFWFNANKADLLARADYAANMGDHWVFWHEGPSPTEAETGNGFFEFRGVDGSRDHTIDDLTGVVFQRRPVELEQISDGLSQILFAGEKPIPVAEYDTGQSLNDDQSAWNGDDWDSVASTQFIPRSDSSAIVEEYGIPFGGPHSDGFVVVNCDGSVHFAIFDVDREVHRASGNRADH